MTIQKRRSKIIHQKDYSVEEMLALGIADKTTSEPGFYFNHGTDFPQGLKESLSGISSIRGNYNNIKRVFPIGIWNIFPYISWEAGKLEYFSF